MEPLKEIPIEGFQACMEYFKTDWPRGSVPYYLMDRYYEYHNRKVVWTSMSFYCPHGNIENGLVGITNDESEQDIFLSCFRESPETLEICLSITHRINWCKNVHFSYIPTNVMPSVERVLKIKGLRPEEDITQSFALILRKENRPFEINIPPEVYIEKLRPDQAEEIDEVWRHRTNISVRLYRNRIEHDRAYGVFMKSDNALASWVLMNELGYATHWFTKEEHRGKGYGQLIMKFFCNLYLAQAKDLTAQTVFKNWASLELLLKMNWDVFGVFRWFYAKKIKDSLNDES